jgi:anti-sigma factor RsiW
MNGPINCVEFETLLSEYPGGADPAGALECIEEHAARCRRCEEALACERELDRLLSAKLQPPALPSGFASRVLQRTAGISPSRSLPAWASWLDAAGVVGVAAAAAAAVALSQVSRAVTFLGDSSVAPANWIIAGGIITAALWWVCSELANLGSPPQPGRVRTRPGLY